MRRALDLAARGWGAVQPNPLVGAVVLDMDGAEVGAGWHERWGAAHAEVVALRAAGDRARGGTLYVTLEPCRHHGRTPPCTTAVRESGVRRVVIAAPDPNREAAGGADELRSAGIEVAQGVLEREARDQNAAFFTWHERGRPFVALKFALSLDGRLSARAGAHTRITGPEADAEVQRLRAGFDAILVGAGTVRADDPLLTVRGEVRPRTPPVRIAVDTRLDVVPGRRLSDTVAAPTWALHGPAAPAERRRELERAGVRLLEVPLVEAGLDMAGALDRLGEEGVRSVFCEGGGRLGASLLRANRVDRHYLFVAPVLLGGDGARAYPDGTVPAAPVRWRRVAARSLGADTMIELAPLEEA